MRVFEIYDTTKRSRRSCAKLFFNEKVRKARIEIDKDANPDDLPFLLSMFAEDGKRSIGHTWAMRWIDERIPPASRQNIGEILRANGLKEYDEIELLARNKGCSSQDDFQVREVTPATEYAYIELDSSEASGYGNKGLTAAMQTIGAKLAQARKSIGLTQADLAERTGIAQAAISRIESGKGNPTMDTLVILANELGLELALVEKA